MVRTIQAETITQEVAQMCKEAAYYLPGDLVNSLQLAETYSTKSFKMPKSLKQKTDQSAKIQA